MEMRIEFTGGSRVEARFGDHAVQTDQPLKDGGENTAPSPFALFLASLATCAGYFVLKFCQSRGIPTEGIYLTQRIEADTMTHGLAAVHIDVHTPQGFPEKYRDAVLRAADQCAVKRTLLDPPEISVTLRPA